MSRTLQGYRELWEGIDNPRCFGDEEITTTECVFDHHYTSSMTGGGYFFCQDFGEAVCFYRYWELLQDLEANDKKELSPESAVRKENAERYFDALLERFVRDGYQPEMGEELINGVNTFLSPWHCRLYNVYVLPGDLERLLDQIGNPLVPSDDEEDEAVLAQSPKFDLDNSEHRAALCQRLWELSS